jgi:predicted RND superfamily exporter protein
MQEILTAVTYLVAWLACEKVFHIESGLIKLLISLGAAVGVYVLIAVKESREKKRKADKD